VTEFRSGSEEYRNDGKIIDSTPAPLGWQACYVLDRPLNEEESIKLLARPIILWVTIEFDDGAQEIRHFIADWDGRIIDHLNLEHEFLCVVAPDQNFEELAKQALQEQVYEKLEKQTALS
jgi:hypothetical protein